jgi:hypothetical protein
MSRPHLIPIASVRHGHLWLAWSGVNGGHGKALEGTLVREHLHTGRDRIQVAVMAAPDVLLVPPERGLLYYRGRRLQP